MFKYLFSLLTALLTVSVLISTSTAGVVTGNYEPVDDKTAYATSNTNQEESYIASVESELTAIVTEESTSPEASLTGVVTGNYLSSIASGVVTGNYHFLLLNVWILSENGKFEWMVEKDTKNKNRVNFIVHNLTNNKTHTIFVDVK